MSASENSQLPVPPDPAKIWKQRLDLALAKTKAISITTWLLLVKFFNVLVVRIKEWKSSPKTDLANRIPGADFEVKTTIHAKQVSTGTIFKALIKRFPHSEAVVEGNQLVILKPDRSIKLGRLDFSFMQNMDGGMGDRRFWDIRATFSVTTQDDSSTIVGQVAQRWSQFAASMIVATPFTCGISAAWMFNVFVRTYLFGNRRIRSSIQFILDDIAKEIQREKLTSSLDSLS